MPRYTIPQRYRRGYEVLVAMPESAFNQVMSALEEARPAPYPPAVAQQAAAAVADHEADARALVDIALMAESVRSSRGFEAEDVARDLLDSDDLALTEAKKSKAKVRLLRLLDLPVIYLTIQLSELSSADERPLASARAVVDVRPVFERRTSRTSNTAPAPSGALIVFVLNLNVHKYTGDESMVVTLDGNDLTNLQDELRRAQQEGESAKAFLLSAGLRPYLAGGDE